MKRRAVGFAVVLTVLLGTIRADASLSITVGRFNSYVYLWQEDHFQWYGFAYPDISNYPVDAYKPVLPIAGTSEPVYLASFLYTLHADHAEAYVEFGPGFISPGIHWERFEELGDLRFTNLFTEQSVQTYLWLGTNVSSPPYNPPSPTVFPDETGWITERHEFTNVAAVVGWLEVLPASGSWERGLYGFTYRAHLEPVDTGGVGVALTLGWDGSFAVDYAPGVIAEPSTFTVWSLLGALALTLAWWRRRRAA
jgi:hypothetical protein